MIKKGKDREEYTWTAARERNRKLRDFFGQELWNVALEPGRRSVFEKVQSSSKRSRLIPVSG